MIELNLKGTPEELIQAEQFIVEGRFEKAYEIMDKFKEKGDYTPKEIILCNLLKIDGMIQQALYDDAIELGNQTYKESLGMNETLLAFDALNLEAIGLFWLNRWNKAPEKIKEVENLLKKLPQELQQEYIKRKAALDFLKSWFNLFTGNIDKVEVLDEFSLTEEFERSRAFAFYILSGTYYYANFKGEFDIALKNIEKGLEISRRNNWKYGIAYGLLNMGVVYNLKGDLEKCITYYKKSLTLFKELNNKHFMAEILNNLAGYYRNTGDLDQGIECIESSINYANEVGNLRALAIYYDFFIQILIDKGNLKQAQKAIGQLEQIKNQISNNLINLQYLFNKALVLKASSRSRDRIEAEDILKQILEDETIDYQIAVSTLLNLCELLLIELGISNDLSVLEEVDIYITQLLEIAEKGHSFILFAEIYFLKAKLALLTIDLKNARRFLTQAERIAERYGYNQLAIEISKEHDKLRNQLSIWDNLREKEISLSERMKLAGMDGQIEYLLRNPAILTTQVKEGQITVLKDRKICIVCKGDILGFMYVCQCNALYCEKCARAITEIENECWVCSTPIDITKPVKHFEEEIGKNNMISKKPKNPKK